jgi:hypothetical protein
LPHTSLASANALPTNSSCNPTSLGHPLQDVDDQLLQLNRSCARSPALLTLEWRERLADVRRQPRAFVHFLTDAGLHPRLRAERAELVAELRALAALAPAASEARPAMADSWRRAFFSAPSPGSTF